MIMISRYPNSLVFLSGLVVALVLFFTGGFGFIVDQLGALNYFGSFLMGIFYAFALTAGFASVAIFAMGERLDPLAVAVLGGLGAMFSDLVLYRFFSKGIVDELKHFSKTRFRFVASAKLRAMLKRKIFRIIGPSLGLLIIASPFPDEMGILILSFYGIVANRWAPLFFVLNAVGIYLLAAAGAAIVK